MSRDIRRRRTASRAGRLLAYLWCCTLRLRGSLRGSSCARASSCRTSTCSACRRRTFRDNNGTRDRGIGELEACQILAWRCRSSCGAEKHKRDAAYHGGLLWQRIGNGVVVSSLNRPWFDPIIEGRSAVSARDIQWGHGCAKRLGCTIPRNRRAIPPRTLSPP